MEKTQYQKMYHWFTQRPPALRCFLFLYRGTTVAVVVGYALLLALTIQRLYWGVFYGLTLWVAAQELVAAVLIPATIFLLGTALRKAINAPRPYEQEGFVPLVIKDKRGQACPSRHVLSVSAIAVAWWGTSVPMVCLMGAIAVLIAVLRVIAGVHSIKDVVAGLLFGSVGGSVLYFIWYSVL